MTIDESSSTGDLVAARDEITGVLIRRAGADLAAMLIAAHAEGDAALAAALTRAEFTADVMVNDGDPHAFDYGLSTYWAGDDVVSPDRDFYDNPPGLDHGAITEAFDVLSELLSPLSKGDVLEVDFRTRTARFRGAGVLRNLRSSS